MKRTLLLILGAVAIVTPVAAQFKETQVVGSWSGKMTGQIPATMADKNDPDGPKKIAAANEMLRGMLFTLSLNANKTFQVSVIQGKNSQKSEGTWKLVGNKVEMIDLKRDGKPVPKAEQEKSKGVFVLDKAAKSMSMNLPGAPAGIKLVFTKK